MNATIAALALIETEGNDLGPEDEKGVQGAAKDTNEAEAGETMTLTAKTVEAPDQEIGVIYQENVEIILRRESVKRKS